MFFCWIAVLLVSMSKSLKRASARGVAAAVFQDGALRPKGLWKAVTMALNTSVLHLLGVASPQCSTAPGLEQPCCLCSNTSPTLLQAGVAQYAEKLERLSGSDDCGVIVERLRALDEQLSGIKAQEEGLRKQLSDIRAKDEARNVDIPKIQQVRL